MNKDAFAEATNPEALEAALRAIGAERYHDSIRFMTFCAVAN